MKKLAGLLLILSLFIFGCGAVKTPLNSLPLIPQTQTEKDLMSATVVIYGVQVANIEGGYFVESYDVCTATAFERDGDTYRFVTAAHCFETKLTDVRCLSLDEMMPLEKPDEKCLFTAKPLVIGNRFAGQDLAVIESKMPGVDLPIIPLAISDPEVGDYVINVGAPKLENKQLYRGVVRKINFYRTIFSDRGTAWRDATLVALSKGAAQGGTSGSAIVSETKGGIMAILVGKTYWTNMTIALPISQFKKFWKDFLATVTRD